jgi:hypothetical protein
MVNVQYCDSYVEISTQSCPHTVKTIDKKNREYLSVLRGPQGISEHFNPFNYLHINVRAE